ncbi:MFS transporter [Rhizocola hellebori]|uniref:MFS transporter n=1 Tax=Rhizocola hellebori TaxID=1392758 RepID=A0A8J3QFF7_9ACTN|nr:MFS transporter [Rhizocola hellebori]GIH08734.1 MFS transporter [Rhizocola hellebori]
MLINRNYAKLWFGQTISVVGDEVFGTTLLIWIGYVLLAGKGYAPAVSSVVLIVTSIVIIFLGPIAGVFVDRWEARRTMLRMDLIRAALISSLIVVSVVTLPLPVTLTIIAVVVALDTAASQFFNPSRIVLLRDIVPEEMQGRASGYAQSAGALASIIGPPLAAPLLVSVGVPWAITVNALSFLVSYLLIRLIKVDPAAVPPAKPREESAGVWREFVSGMRFIGGHSLVRAVLILAVVVQLGIGAFVALDLYFVAENLNAEPKWFGVLGGAFGVGAVIGSFTGGFLGDRLGHVRVIVGGFVLSGAFLFAYSRLESVWPALAVIAGLGYCIGALNTALAPVLMRVVPRDLLGRVFAVIMPANRLGAIVSIAVTSVLVSTVLKDLDTTLFGMHLGRIDAVFGCAALIVTASGIYFWFAARSLPDSIE